MKLELTNKELGLVLMGLYAAADGAYTMEEQMEYEALADRIEEIMATSTRCNLIGS
jgi:hypothetical protein